MWEVEYTEEFDMWWNTLSDKEQDALIPPINELEEHGPHLGHPKTSKIFGSRHSNMRELRVQCHGDPFRVLYAFDPRQAAILLIGGNKAGKDRWYKEYVPWADDIYDEHLRAIADELQKTNGRK